ncbi:MAG: ParB/RepB/Spo0J family partition protein [Erysipelotrichaceae bacterium]|nr:ParB/RepB/Spo0J family partition protein [Erysipelotrichaceae bacterium]
MTQDNKRLGKGLSSIFGGDITQMLDDIQNGQDTSQNYAQLQIPVDQIRPNPYQPRKIFNEEALEELAASIREHGVFTPILVKKSIHGYELIAGERRLRASKLAQKTEIPAIIVDFNDQEMMEISLLENIQREDLNVIEEAKAYDELIKKLHYTQEQLATRVGKSREHIANLLRLLRLPEEVSQMVIDKKLSMGHVRALLSLKDKPSMIKLANKAYQESWSVRKMEQKVKEALEAASNEPKIDPKKAEQEAFDNNIFIQDAHRQLEEFFQTPVKIKPNSITIRYETLQDLTRILELLDLTETE